MYGRELTFVIISALLFSGCATGGVYKTSKKFYYMRPKVIAVLPAMNETVDLDAPIPFPGEVRRALRARGYKTAPDGLVRKKLEEEGIQVAAQVNAIPDKELGDAFQSEALMFTTVTSWETVYLGMYASVTVGARFDLVDVNTSELLWVAEDEIKDRKVGLDEKTAKRTIAFAALQAYEPLVTRLVNKSFKKLPHGPYASGELPSHVKPVTAEDIDSTIRNIRAIIRIVDALSR